MMANEFEMSMIGELSYFLGLQIKQLKNGTNGDGDPDLPSGYGNYRCDGE